jgi:hypothetical protein
LWNGFPTSHGLQGARTNERNAIVFVFDEIAFSLQAILKLQLRPHQVEERVLSAQRLYVQ